MTANKAAVSTWAPTQAGRQIDTAQGDKEIAMSTYTVQEPLHSFRGLCTVTRTTEISGKYESRELN